MRKIPCFSDVIDNQLNYTMIDLGVRVIEVAKITGTVDKCRDLDGKFRSIRKHTGKERYRRKQILDHMRRGVFFDPIEVYQFNNAYYVLDGNRRTASAKELKAQFLDAHIIRYIEQNNKKAVEGFHKHQHFETETGLETINLKNESGFETLLELIKAHPGGSSVKEKAKLWKSEVYLPALSDIKESEITEGYPNEEPGDIFIRIINFFQDFMGRGARAQENVGIRFASPYPHLVYDDRPSAGPHKGDIYLLAIGLLVELLEALVQALGQFLVHGTDPTDLILGLHVRRKGRQEQYHRKCGDNCCDHDYLSHF